MAYKNQRWYIRRDIEAARANIERSYLALTETAAKFEGHQSTIQEELATIIYILSECENITKQVLEKI